MEASIKNRVANIFVSFAEDMRPNLDDITLDRIRSHIRELIHFMYLELTDPKAKRSA